MNELTAKDLILMELLEDRLLVIEERNEKTSTGLYLVTDLQWMRRGVVIKTGPGFHPVGMPLKVGDKIHYGKDAGVELIFNMLDDFGVEKPTVLQLIRLSGVLLCEDQTTEGDPVGVELLDDVRYPDFDDEGSDEDSLPF